MTGLQTNDFKIIRVDGPFENSGVLCLVGALGILFLSFIPGVLSAGSLYEHSAFPALDRCLRFVSVCTHADE